MESNWSIRKRYEESISSLDVAKVYLADAEFWLEFHRRKLAEGTIIPNVHNFAIDIQLDRIEAALDIIERLAKE